MDVKFKPVTLNYFIYVLNLKTLIPFFKFVAQCEYYIFTKVLIFESIFATSSKQSWKNQAGPEIASTRMPFWNASLSISHATTSVCGASYHWLVLYRSLVCVTSRAGKAALWAVCIGATDNRHNTLFIVFINSQI